MQNYQNLTQEKLREYYKTKGSLLLLDVPEGLEFGIDNVIWKIGNKFKGLKFIPLGSHIISYTLKEQNNMFKISKFLNFSAENNVLVYKWHQNYSMFMELKGSQAQGYKEGVKNYHFDCYLGPYPEQNIQFWRDNTSFITKQVLQKLDPVQKIYKFEQQYQKLKVKQSQELKIDIDNESDDQNIDDQMQIIQEMQNQLKKQQIQKQDTTNIKDKNNTINKKFQTLTDTIYYSQIPRKLKDQPDHINRINIDKTQILIEVIQQQWRKYPLGLLGQIQYSFIHFLIGQDQDSFNQWKKIINLFVFSQCMFYEKQFLYLTMNQVLKNQNKQNIIEKFQKLSLEFIVIIYNQLKQFPIDFFINQLSKDSFLQKCLKRLKSYSLIENQNSVHISKKVKKRLEKVFKLLKEKFDYQIEEQEIDQQYAPTIVDQQNQSYF